MITSSTKRCEYPYSLSYHATTLTKLPSTTWVNAKSTMEEAGLATMSERTMGSSVTSSMPLNRSVLEAAINAWLISSLVTFFLSNIVKSDNEPTGVGTRKDTPSNFPLSDG